MLTKQPLKSYFTQNYWFSKGIFFVLYFCGFFLCKIPQKITSRRNTCTRYTVLKEFPLLQYSSVRLKDCIKFVYKLSNILHSIILKVLHWFEQVSSNTLYLLIESNTFWKYKKKKTQTFLLHRITLISNCKTNVASTVLSRGRKPNWASIKISYLLSHSRILLFKSLVNSLTKQLTIKIPSWLFTSLMSPF